MRLTPICALLVIAALLSLTGCRNREREKTTMTEDVKVRHHLQENLTDRGVHILEGATSGKSYEVSRPRPQSTHLIGGAPVVAEGPDLTLADVDELRKLLFVDRNYYLDRKKRTPFIPQVAFVLKAPEGEVTLLAAMYTAQLRFVMGERQLTIDFDPAADQWRQFVTRFVKVPSIDETPTQGESNHEAS